MSKTIDLEQIPVIKELVEAAIDEKTTPLEEEIEDIKKNGDKVNIFILHDWDDTEIGAVAVPMGYDPRPYINEYVKTHLIHPDLRNQTAEQLASIERTDSYRGEYPHTGPDPEDPLATGGADTVEDGGDYPLTNHLDYVFMGKDLDPEYPYVSGWTEVTAENMADTFTALSANSDKSVPASEFGDMPELDENGNPVNEGDVIPRVVRFDWTQFISGGYANPVTARLKAVYRQGRLNGRGGKSYVISDTKYTLRSAGFNANTQRYDIIITYSRINVRGQGVELQKQRPHVYAQYYLDNDTTPIVAPIPTDMIDNDGTLLARMPAEARVSIIGHTLYSNRGLSTAIGTAYTSKGSRLYKINDTHTGFAALCVLGFIAENTAGKGNFSSISLSMLQAVDLRTEEGGLIAQFGNAEKSALKPFVAAMVAAQGNTPTITYYQLQWAFLNEGAYLDADAAKAACLAAYEWCDKVEEGGDTTE